MLLVAVAGCQPREPDTPVSLDIHIVESSSLPVPLRDGASAVFSLLVENAGSEDVVITNLHPIADSYLDVEYLGYSSCLKGCAGAQLWNQSVERQVRRGIEGTFPVVLAAGQHDYSLTFRLIVSGPDGVARLQDRGCLILESVIASLDGDGRERVSSITSEGWLAAVRSRQVDASGTEPCPR